MRTKLIAGNWKMNGSLASNPALLQAMALGGRTVSQVDWVVLVPSPYLGQTAECLRGSVCAWGAQDLSEEAQGAFTGEVSASMLQDFGCRYVIVGHSERRQRQAESDERVAAKAQAALRGGLIPIICVGESLAQRQAGETLAVVHRQLDAVLDRLGAELAGGVLAYEPVWAIGTGQNATADQAEAVHRALRLRVAERFPEVAAGLRILYGGSVKPSNAVELMTRGEIDGALVGGASLVADDLLAIGRAVAPH